MPRKSPESPQKVLRKSSESSLESPQKVLRKSSESPHTSVIHYQSFDWLPIPRARQDQPTSPISNFDQYYFRQTDRQTDRVFWQALIQRPPFRDGLMSLGVNPVTKFSKLTWPWSAEPLCSPPLIPLGSLVSTGLPPLCDPSHEELLPPVAGDWDIGDNM